MVCYEGRSIKEFFIADLEDGHIWYDLGAFAEIVDINGHKVKGILTSRTNSRYHRRDDTQGYSQGDMILYVKCSDVSNVTAGQSVRVNGVMFTVESHSVIGHAVRRIELSANDP